jgi:hypothetical protein
VSTPQAEVHSRPEQSTALAPAQQSTALTAPGETASASVSAREKAAVEARFMMAIGRPRSVDAARLRILDACRRPRFAEAARYLKPIGGGKKIPGFSIRFAEEVARLWGNLDITSAVVFDDAERRIYRVAATDLETNTSQNQDVIVEKRVERSFVKEGQVVVSRRLNSQGKETFLVEATEDDLHNKANAALAKVRRNLIHALIPADIREEAEETCIETMKNRDAEDPEGARKRITEAFWGIGVTPQQVEVLLGHPLAQINPAELTMLRSIYTAIKDGEATWDQSVEAYSKKAPAPAPAKPAGPKRPRGLQAVAAQAEAPAPEPGDAAEPPPAEEEI